MKRKECIVIAVLFALLITVPLVGTLVSPKRTFSDWENRPLQTLPEASVDTVLSGEFGSEFETWLTDQFVARDFWVKFKRSADSMLGIRESNGVAIGENALFDIPDEVNTVTVEKNISAINSFIEKTKLPTSLILVPSTVEVFPEEAPAGFPSKGEEELVENIYSKINAETVDTLPPLRKLDFEDAFYKTDHHWTSVGAACVYAEWINSGNSYSAKTVAEEFFGTLTSRSGDTTVEADSIKKITSGDNFTLCKVFNGRETAEYSSMYFEEYLDSKDKYSYFLGSNQPIVTLEAGNNTGRTLLVFKDSFAHTFVQCCGNDFDRVILVDLRYITAPIDAYEQINLDEITDVLFLYSVENFTTLDNMMWIK